MTRPRLLDLFCGAGGAATGYHRAGFEVIGVDHRPQPNYPFTFVQAEVIEWLGSRWTAWRYDGCGFPYHAIHASPPCQAYSKATAWRGDRAEHPDLIAQIREIISWFDVPYVIENVEDARHLLRHPLMLCGSTFGLPFRRHRYFEAPSLPLVLVSPCQHRGSDFSFDHGAKQTERTYADAMQCEWMTVHEARQAIPPVYTEHLGRQLIRALENPP